MERNKHDRYGPGVLPLAVETFGRWGPSALKWWRALAKQVVAANPSLAGSGRWAVQNLLQRWWAQVAVALQRANADAVRASLGVVGGGQGVNHVEVPAAYELLLPVSGADL